MLAFAVYLRLKEELSGISSLTLAFRGGAGAYSRAARKFLAELQRFADETRSDVASDLAVELQKLALYDGKDVKGNRLKACDNFAAGCIERAQAAVKKYLEKFETAYSECESVCRQIAAQLLLFDPSIGDADGILAAMRSTEQLRAYYAQLVGMVGAFNLRAVMQYVLPQVK